MVAADFGIVKSCSTRKLSVFEEEGRWGKGLRRERQEGRNEGGEWYGFQVRHILEGGWGWHLGCNRMRMRKGRGRGRRGETCKCKRRSAGHL